MHLHVAMSKPQGWVWDLEKIESNKFECISTEEPDTEGQLFAEWLEKQERGGFGFVFVCEPGIGSSRGSHARFFLSFGDSGSYTVLAFTQSNYCGEKLLAENYVKVFNEKISNTVDALQSNAETAANLNLDVRTPRVDRLPTKGECGSFWKTQLTYAYPVKEFLTDNTSVVEKCMEFFEL